MFRKNLFPLFVIAALLVLAALTAHQAIENIKVVSAAPYSAENTNLPLQETCVFTDQARQSLRTSFIEAINRFLPQTEDGYTGIDGGAMALLECQ